MMILLAMFLTAAITVGSVGNAKANHAYGYNDGNGCIWWHVDEVWIGQCYRLATTTWGTIWAYNGAWQNPWIQAGTYDASYDYYFNFQGGYQSRVERSTQVISYPSACGWIDANTICGYVGGSTTPTNSIPAYVGGGSTPPSNPVVAGAVSQIIDTWLSPNCTASYDGC